MLITIFAPPKVHLLEIAGVRDALFEANSKIGSGHAYRVRLVTETGAPEVSASGTTFLPDSGIEDASEPCDTLIVTGPYGTPARPSDAVLEWLRRQAQHARRFGSTCTGAFPLAHAGLLAGRQVTTHWQYAQRLEEMFPDIEVVPDRIFVRDGPAFSSAGVSAAIDLAFSLIEEDYGRSLSLWVARRLVVFLRRPGGQSQFSSALTIQSDSADPLDKIRLHIFEHPRAALGLDELARIACMSPRNLSRLFRAKLGLTPSAYVETIRIEIARRLLEESDAPLKVIAHTAGFGSVSTLRRAFIRRLSVTPLQYRSHFQTAGTGDAQTTASGAILS